MTRPVLLRIGYAGLGLAILTIPAALVPALGALFVLGPILAFAGAACLAFSRDDLPKWAGIAFLVYALATLVAFLAATPATIRLSFWKGFANADPPAAAEAIMYYLGLGLPVMVVGTALVAAWERENGARLLLAGGLVGVLAVGVLTVALNPAADAAGDAGAGNASQDAERGEILRAESKASSQANLLSALLALTALSGAAGALWAAWRPEAYH